MMNRRTRGFLQAAIGTFAVTPDAVLLRLAEMHGNAPLWTATAVKLMFIGFFCSLHPLSGGVQTLVAGARTGPTHVFLAALGQGLINMGYSLAFLTTTVAEALMLISLHPLWGALGGRIVLKEKIPKRTVVALVCSLCAILIIFVPPAVTGTDGGQRSTLHGNLIAVATGLSVAGTILVNRHAGTYRPEALAPSLEFAAGVGSVACGLVALPMACAEASPSLASSNTTAAVSAGTCSAFGALLPPFWPLIALDGMCIAICTVLATVYAPRHIFAAEVGLVLLGEQILSPVWTFIGVGEAPSSWTLAGGSLLIVTLGAHEAAALVEERREAQKGEEEEAKEVEVDKL